jgi:hypothetical protein
VRPSIGSATPLPLLSNGSIPLSSKWPSCPDSLVSGAKSGRRRRAAAAVLAAVRLAARDAVLPPPREPHGLRAPAVRRRLVAGRLLERPGGQPRVVLRARRRLRAERGVHPRRQQREPDNPGHGAARDARARLRQLAHHVLYACKPLPVRREPPGLAVGPGRDEQRPDSSERNLRRARLLHGQSVGRRRRLSQEFTPPPPPSSRRASRRARRGCRRRPCRAGPSR